MFVQGKLRRNDIGRWEFQDEESDEIFQLTSGSVCEVRIGKEWIRTTIEHYKDYYATTKGVELCEGLEARVAY